MFIQMWGISLQRQPLLDGRLRSTLPGQKPRRGETIARARRRGRKDRKKRPSAQPPPPLLLLPAPSEFGRMWRGARPQVSLEDEATLKRGAPARKLGVRRRAIYLLKKVDWAATNAQVSGAGRSPSKQPPRRPPRSPTPSYRGRHLGLRESPLLSTMGPQTCPRGDTPLA